MLPAPEASSVDKPAAIALQNLLSSLRPAIGGRPSEGNGALPERSDRRLHLVIEAPHEALRRPLESAQLAPITARGRSTRPRCLARSCAGHATFAQSRANTASFM